MANVSNGKHRHRQKSPGVMKKFNNGKCLKWQVFLMAKVSIDKTWQMSQMAITSLAKAIEGICTNGNCLNGLLAWRQSDLWQLVLLATVMSGKCTNGNVKAGKLN